MAEDSLHRFSNRVDDYIKYRPNYPDALINFLTAQHSLSKQSVVADMGSGTGILSELFLKNGNTVFAVEPNKEMREAAEKRYLGNLNFISVDATAEKTTLRDNTIDMIVAGQAFHWFDKSKSKIEFNRILKQNATVVLIWNDRRIDTTPFLIEYENLLKKYGTDYLKVNHKNIGPEQMNAFFGKEKYSFTSFSNFQYFDFEGLKGRLLSSSYVPTKEQPGFNSMIDSLKEIFDTHNSSGKVTIEYDTKIYAGKLK